MHVHAKALVAACVLVSFFPATPGFAQESASIDSLIRDPAPPVARGELTLDGALALSRVHHPSLRGEAWRVRAAQARHMDAGRFPNPLLDLEVANFGGALGNDRLESTLLADQTIELGGKRGARSATADALRELALAELSEEERRVLGATAERFVAAWALQERLGRLAGAESLAQRSIVAAEERHRAGAGPAVERVRAEAVHALRQAERLRARAEWAASLRRLVSQWGSTVVEIDSVVLSDPTSPPPLDLSALEALLDRHPERRRAAAEAVVEDARLREARAACAPDVSVRGGVRHLAESDGTGLVAGVSVPLPLWSRGRGSLVAAEAERSAARSREHLVALRLEVELRSAYESFKGALATFEAMRTVVQPKHEEALRQVADGYRAGRFSSLEFLEAQRGLLETELALVDAQADAWRARSTLELLVGVSLDRIQTPVEGR